MDAPTIQYCKTRDGVSIAYWTMGEGGVPLVLSNLMVMTHATFELRQPVLRAWYERLASRRMIVRYDESRREVVGLTVLGLRSRMMRSLSGQEGG